MAKRSGTTIAAIMLADAPQLAIDTLADEVLRSKIAERAGARSVCWDCEDLVFIDFDTLRIAIHDVPATEHSPSFVCLAVGAVPGCKLPLHIDSARLAHGLVKRLSQIVVANAVLWHEDARSLGTEVMDDFQDELEKMLDYLDMQMAQAKEDAVLETLRDVAPTETAAKPAVPKRVPLNRPITRGAALNDEASLKALRAQLREKGMQKEPISTPIHASIYLMACTFFFMVPAIGTALFSYIALRDGVDKPKTNP
ncbi:hypothetical protein [Planktotalea sp.]|uniref:hypothetical protein n=1 Tax=Planktotalea sp. TaxID=2029877 RepID=UPI003D6B4C7A